MEQKQVDKEMRALRTYIVVAVLNQESNTFALQGFTISTSIVGKSLFRNGDIFQERSIDELTSR
jgi:hypothetical protein